MTTLVFFLALTAIAGMIYWIEGGTDAHPRPAGLLTWIVSGNWPAKIGAVLILVGTGALLRYLAIHIELAPTIKLGAGVAIAGALGLAAMLTGKGAGQRTLSLVLGGSAYGVAYLTAYSAFVLFGLLGNTTGVGLLMLTAAASGAFAVNRGALSLALLAMIGAYLAPAFSVTDPGPLITCSYYAAATMLTLFIVALRGWRPLIHLSFLFTLAGGVFFAWTARYYHPEHFDQMAPMLWVLVSLHIMLPIAERRHVRGRWIERLDMAYLLALPLTATLLAFAIAPSSGELSLLVIMLGFAWLAAAAYLGWAARGGAAAHAVIGTVMMGLGLAARFRGLPWDVIALAIATGALALASYRSQSQRLRNVLAGLVLMLGAVHALASLQPATGTVFINGAFIERAIAAALIIYASVLCRRVQQPLAGVLLFSGIGWAILTVVAEFLRWQLVSVALALHLALLAVALIVFALDGRVRLGRPLGLGCALGILGTAAVAGPTMPVLALISLFAAPVALLALATRRDAEEEKFGSGRVIAALGVPVVAVLWAQDIGMQIAHHEGHFLLAAAALAAAVTLLVGRLAPARSTSWLSVADPLFTGYLGLALLILTTADVSRDSWAIAAELICLAGIGLHAWDGATRDASAGSKSAFVIGAALLLQAHMLRWFGPAGDLTVLDVGRMRWPATISLLWAAVGAAMTIWARRQSARAMWLAGATLLVAAAVKVVLIDFGSLGELQNILAVIAAGAMFLLVGWLAPIPPAAPKEPTEFVARRSR